MIRTRYRTPIRQAGVLALVFALAWIGCAAGPARGADESVRTNVVSQLPADAARVVERVIACNHFAGETGDNTPEREREITAAVEALGCDRVKQDVAAMRSKYADDREVEKALADAAAL